MYLPHTPSLITHWEESCPSSCFLDPWCCLSQVLVDYHSLAQSLTHSLAAHLQLTRSPAHLQLTRSPAHSQTHLLARSLTNSLAHSLAPLSLTNLLEQRAIHWGAFLHSIVSVLLLPRAYHARTHSQSVTRSLADSLSLAHSLGRELSVIVLP